MRAALAASTPAGASSHTRHPLRGHAEPPGRGEEHSGVRLAIGLVLRRVHQVEQRSELEVREHEVDQPVLGGRRHRQRQPAGTAHLDDAAGAGLETPLGHHQRHHAVDDRHGDLVGPRTHPRRALEPVARDLAHVHALGLPARRGFDRDAEAAQHLHLGPVPEGLGVDEQAVHVEDGRREPAGAVAGPQVGSCSSMAATRSGASGSTCGRKRPTTSPVGERRNFSKFHVMSPASPAASGTAVSAS